MRMNFKRPYWRLMFISLSCLALGFVDWMLVTPDFKAAPGWRLWVFTLAYFLALFGVIGFISSLLWMLGSINTTTRVVSFGVVSGLIWSVVPGCLSNLFGSTGADITVVVSGILTGVLISLALKLPLQTFGRGSSICFGALALPLGAFLFGVVVSVVQLTASKMTGTTYAAIDPIFNPFGVGLLYAFISVISLYAIVLFPLAVLTTFILRVVIHKRENAV